MKTLKGGTGGPGVDGGSQITCSVGPLCEGKDTKADGDCVTQSVGPRCGGIPTEYLTCVQDGSVIDTGGNGIVNTIQLCD